MGSLRNPAAWANIFGLRPSQGRVPMWPAADVFVAQLATEGPMARSVGDLARLLSVQAGGDARSPLSIPEGPQQFDATPLPFNSLRVGWLGDLGGHLAMEDGLLATCESALQRLSGDGAHVEPIALGFSPEALWQSWLVWRRALVGPRIAAVLRAYPGGRDRIKPEALWEHDQAQGLGFMDFMAASETRSAFYNHLLGLFERFDVLALPATQVWPFAVGQRWPQSVAGRTMDTYHRWMEVTLYATLAGLPAISVPAGFHANDLWPAGLQLIGKPQGDGALLRVAASYEQLVSDWLSRRPPARATPP
jgi:amidase